MSSIAACGGGASNTDPAANDDAFSGGMTVGIGPAGGQLAFGQGTLVFAAGALSSNASVSVVVATDAGMNAVFDEGAWYLPLGTKQSDVTVRVRLTVAVMSEAPTITLSLSVPPEIAEAATDADPPLLLYYGQYFNTDDDRGESIASVDQIDATYDALTHTLTAKLPADAFNLDVDGALQAAFRLAAMPTSTVATARTSSSRATPSEHLESTFPSMDSAAGATDADQYFNPLGDLQLKILGPFGETEGGHVGTRHGGIDFFTETGPTPKALGEGPVGVPVYASREGFIERIGVSGCGLDGKPVPAMKKPWKKFYKPPPPDVCTNAKRDSIFYVLIRHPDKTTTRYLHLKNFSVLDPRSPIPVLLTEGAMPSAEFQRSWQQPVVLPPLVPLVPPPPRYPVKRGQQIATSGDTGADKGPHLHFEAGTGSSSNGRTVGAYNAILKLGQLKVSPDSVQIHWNIPDEIRAYLVDNSKGSQEIVVRRSKDPETYYSVTSQSPTFPEKSRTPVVEVRWYFDSTGPTELGTQLRINTPQYPDKRAIKPLIGTDGGTLSLSEGKALIGPATTHIKVTLKAVKSVKSAVAPETTFLVEKTEEESVSRPLSKEVSVAGGVTAKISQVRAALAPRQQVSLTAAMVDASGGNVPAASADCYWRLSKPEIASYSPETDNCLGVTLVGTKPGTGQLDLRSKVNDGLLGSIPVDVSALPIELQIRVSPGYIYCNFGCPDLQSARLELNTPFGNATATLFRQGGISIEAKIDTGVVAAGETFNVSITLLGFYDSLGREITLNSSSGVAVFYGLGFNYKESGIDSANPWAGVNLLNCTPFNAPSSFGPELANVETCTAIVKPRQ